MYIKYTINLPKHIFFILIFFSFTLPVNSELSVEEIIKVLKELSANVGIFISDHNFRDVINVCDEIILLNQGEVLLKGDPKDVKNDPLAKKFYFGDLN
jgi:ABC-type lipopolysaccharide export system ATPase subunit